MSKTNMFASIRDDSDDESGIMEGLDKVIPTGSWTLYFHDVHDDWSTLSTYKKIGTFKKYSDFVPLWDALSDETLLNGHFFMMRDPIPPMWERSENLYGGTYSMVVPRTESAEVYRTYVYAAATGALAKDPGNKISGICISKKFQSNLITIWNVNADKYNNPSDINIYNALDGQILYKANASKNYDKKPGGK